MDKTSTAAIQAIEEKVKANDPTPSQTSSAPCSPASDQPAHDVWQGFDPYCSKLKEAKRAVGSWYNDGLDKGEALVIAGSYGCGKTHLARVVVAAYGAELSRFLSEPDLFAHLRASYDGAESGSSRILLSTLRRASLLVLDDIGAGYVKRGSEEWAQEIYWQILDRRAELHLGTLITTNLSMIQLGRRIGGKALSRLTGMMPRKDNFVDLFGVDDYRLRGLK